MKILFFTDTHIRGNNPVNRKDIFVESLEKKFLEIKQIVKEKDIDFILHGGDLLDRPDISVSVVNRFVEILISMNKPMYMISGNHDIYGHNPKTINRTLISLLNTLNVLKLIGENDSIILKKDEVKVQITGQPYTFGIDGENKKKFYTPNKIEENIDCSIHMVHGLLLEKHFIKTIDHTVIDDIKDTKADILLCGHYHSGFGSIYHNDKYFINPGSIARITNSLAEIKRIPKVVILDIKKDDFKIELIELKNITPGEEALDREKIESAVFKGERLYEFKQVIDASADFEKMDINDVLLEVSSIAEVEEKVKKEALKRIAEIQMREIEN